MRTERFWPVRDKRKKQRVKRIKEGKGEQGVYNSSNG